MPGLVLTIVSHFSVEFSSRYLSLPAIILILQVRKLSHRRVKLVAQVHTASHGTAGMGTQAEWHPSRGRVPPGHQSALKADSPWPSVWQTANPGSTKFPSGSCISSSVKEGKKNSLGLHFLICTTGTETYIPPEDIVTIKWNNIFKELREEIISTDTSLWWKHYYYYCNITPLLPLSRCAHFMVHSVSRPPQRLRFSSVRGPCHFPRVLRSFLGCHVSGGSTGYQGTDPLAYGFSTEQTFPECSLRPSSVLEAPEETEQYLWDI